MAQPKGHTGNPNGRPKGSKNQRTMEWEALGEAILSKHSARANEVLSTMPDDKFLENYGKLLEYFKPKQSRTEVKQEGTTEVTIRVIEGNE
jgi:hypothetical protein